jgi:hypothetical protein
MRAFLILVLGGCASLDPNSCRRADWYDAGFRDAMYGLQRQDDTHALQCAAHGVKIDVARYAQGWREGKYEFDQRTAYSHD